MPNPAIHSNPHSLALDLKTIGRLARRKRQDWRIDIVDAAKMLRISVEEVGCLERGQPVLSDTLVRVLNEMGLAMIVLPEIDASLALAAIGYHVEWPTVSSRSTRARKRVSKVTPPLDNWTPTVFLNFDGTLQIGRSTMDEAGTITLDTGRPLLELANVLIDLLDPYPKVELVLTTPWVNVLPEPTVASYMPEKLACRIAGTTRAIKPRLSSVFDGTDRIHVIRTCANDRRLRNWLAIEHAEGGIDRLSRKSQEVLRNFLFVDPEVGIGEPGVQRYIQRWLADVHVESESFPESRLVSAANGDSSSTLPTIRG